MRLGMRFSTIVLCMFGVVLVVDSPIASRQLSASSEPVSVSTRVSNPQSELALTYLSSDLWTGVKSVTAAGSHAYVSMSYGMKIFEISDPATPSPVSELYLPPGGAKEIRVVGNYAYVAGGEQVRVIDVSLPSAPFAVATLPAFDAVDIEVNGSHAYVANRDVGLLVIDVSVPTSPVQVGSTPTIAQANGVAIAGNYAYVATDFGLTVVDISDPSLPSVVSSYDSPGASIQVALDDTVAYLADIDSLQVLSISNPLSPYRLTAYRGIGPVFDAVVSGTEVFIACHGAGVEVLDITNPSSLVSIGSLSPTGEDVRLSIADTLLLIAEAFPGSLRIASVSSPSSIGLLSEFSMEVAVQDVEVRDTIAYVAAGFRGLSILDVSDQSNPVVVGGLPLPGYAYGLDISGSFAFVAVGGCIYTIDISDPLMPSNEGTFCFPGDARDPLMIGTTLYAPYGNAGFVILDATLPTALSLIGSFAPGDFVHGSDVDGNTAYLATNSSGLIVIDITTPAIPTLLGTLALPAEAYDLEVTFPYAHIANRWNGLVVANVSSPALPMIETTIPLAGNTFSITKLGDYEYVCSEGSGVHAINSVDPSDPFVAASLRTCADCGNGQAIRLGNKVYVADHRAFTILSITPTGDPVLKPDTMATGLSSPVFVTAPDSDTERVFVVELPGTIRIIKNGSVLPDPFLDLSGIVCTQPENGLLGMAFHPDYETNGYFYVHYMDSDCNVHISRFNRLPTSADSADAGSEFTILTIDQPDNPNHNGGTIAFGPDGMLYIPTGDGTCCGDPFGNAQNSNVLLGKLLRIDVDGGSPYAIPADNPYSGSGSVLNEIVGFGLRNPYRCSFDRETGDLYLADVGQNTWEEVSFVDASALTNSRNLGWPTIEGTHCYDPPVGCDATGLQMPIHEYEHLGQCSITGGYVYRGCAIPDLQGRYVFGDFCTGQIWSITHDGASVTELLDHTSDIGTGFGLIGFGEDARGELYMTTLGGAVIKIIPRGPAAGCPDVCACDCHADPAPIGSCDGNQDVLDVVQTVNVAFRGAAAILDPNANCLIQTTDVNCSGATDVLDVVRMVNVAFRGANAATEFCVPCP